MIEQKIKKEFVKEILKSTSSPLQEALEKAILKRNLVDTGNMLNTVNVEYKSAKENDGILNYKHIIYQRFLDMKKEGVLSKKRKQYSIHNRIVFGFYNKIAYRLMYDMTEDVVARIKKDLENGKENS